MAEETQGSQNIQADNNSIAFGGISVGGNAGDIRIGHTIGYTSEQVSTLITQISTTFQPRPFDGRSPYKGLDVFEEEDAELFFGREKLVQDLVVRIRESRTVFVTGPSGSGKSSLVRAGLIHALKQGAIPGSERWLYATLKPGRDPIQALAIALSRLKDPGLGKYFRENAEQASTLHECAESVLTERKDQRLVLFIDQFEEVFTQLSKDKAESFIQLLDCAASTENGRVILLFAMRSDFVSNCATYPKINALLNQQFVQIGAMQGDELVSAIAEPALRVGLRIDPDLIAQIINDMHGEPGALPLMQFALKDLFDSQQAKGGLIALTLSDYLERGGIRKALERHADKTFAGLSNEEQELARSIFTGLIEIGRGTQDTRRTAIFDELVPASAPSASVEAIVAKLADARLITTDEIAGKDTVTISHEKLIDAWPWLKRLVNENRDAIALQNEIAEDAKEWEEHKRDPSYLYSGARLATAQEKMTAQKIMLSGLAKEFIEHGIALQHAERKAKEGLRRRITIGLTTGIAISLALAVLALYQMFRAREQASIARAGELAAQSIALRDKDFSVSLLLGVEAYREYPSVQAQGALLDNAEANPLLQKYLVGHQDQVFSVAFSTDGKILASGSRDKTIILWDLQSHQPIEPRLIGHKASVLSMDFSPDGALLASGSGDETIILWDVKTHQVIDQLVDHHARIYSVAFHPNGSILASGGQDSAIILWDMNTHRPLGSPIQGHAKTVTAIAFTPDGKILASGSEDKKIILWDVENHQQIDLPLDGHTQAITTLAFNPDGRILASGGADNRIILWDVERRQPIDELTDHDGYITSVAFSDDGKRLVSGSVDRTIILWNLESHPPSGKSFTGHSNWVRAVAFSPDGHTIASGGADTMVVLWDLRQNPILGQLLTGHKEPVFAVAISPDGQTIASSSRDETILLWDMKTGQMIAPPITTDHGFVNSVAFSPDGKLLASGYEDGSIIFWDVESHRSMDPPPSGHGEAVYSVAFSPDGKILASSSADDSIILWDVQSRQRIGQLTGHKEDVKSIAFSRDGSLLASGSDDNNVMVWNVEDQQPIAAPFAGHKEGIYSVAFSPDSKIVASSSKDFSVILWNLEDQQPITAPLSSQNGFIYSVAFSPDGKTLASAGYQKSIQLWNIENKKNPMRLGEPLANGTLTISSLVFSPDGKSLIAGSADNSVIRWNLDPEYWIQKICERVSRSFSTYEWTHYFPDKEPRATCPQSVENR